MSHPAVIINPASANGSTGKIWPQIETAIREAFPDFTPYFTERPNHAMELTRLAHRNGHSAILAIGGDGTLSEIVNGYFENGKRTGNLPLGVLMRGTGRDFIKSLKIPGDLKDALAVIREGKTKRIDAGRVSFIDHQGNRTTRYFINVASFGMAGAVDARVNSTSKALGGLVSFLLATLITLIRYHNQTIRLRIDDRTVTEQTVRNVAVGNGRFFGGGMMICPKAIMDDGIFEVTVVGNISRTGSAMNLANLYRGTLQRIPQVSFYRGKKIEAESRETVLLDVDGEQPGKLPATFEIIPEAIDVFVPS